MPPSRGARHECAFASTLLARNAIGGHTIGGAHRRGGGQRLGREFSGERSSERNNPDENWIAAVRLGRGSVVNEYNQAPSSNGAQRERELQRANDFHGVLLAMAGHDLRQPLQAIMSSFDWLSQRLETDSAQEYLKRGRVAISSLTDQLDLLIEALRLHEHSAHTESTTVALAPIFARLHRDNEDLAASKGISLRTHATYAAVMSDAVLLEGILRNLIRNALKYTSSAEEFSSDVAAGDRC